MQRETAFRLAGAHSIPLDMDFHALNAEQVDSVIAAADEYRYRKPKNANGSRGRYFHALLVRASNRNE